MLRELIQQQPHKFYASNHHIYDAETDKLVATTFGEDYKIDHLLAASKAMQLALIDLKRLRFGASGSMPELAAAILSAEHALALSEGEIQ